MEKIRVMIVEDSMVVRELLRHLIGRDPRLQVAGVASSGEEALRILERVSPDVISMDIRLPGMNGFEATQHIMARKPTPVVVVSASVGADDLNISMNALRAGALSVVEKPVGVTHQEYDLLAERLCSQLFNMSQVKVIRQRIDRGVRFPAEAQEASIEQPPPSRVSRPFQMLGVVASTGGPNALIQVLGQLPADLRLSIVVVQHITNSFLEGFVGWLSGLVPFPVRLAQDGEVARFGTIYLPPADMHLRVAGGRLRLDRGPFVSMQRPSGTVLFRSMAESLGASALGVLLTGMGEDGAEGLAEIRSRGGYTIAEDESTAVVYGMPAAAVRLRAVCELLPLYDIAARIRELTGKGGGWRVEGGG